ncbi:LysM peptidoglycan-binding domain-containing protein [Chitinimonas sp. BJB300]|uniref:LysM peptidoglycan-binding domain-containing protein n=2 Tax=Chitinimonas sp. BJB300 TaxID=1559339 RepID=UPI001E4411B6|nr:LysM peptidoglycan-binding domain-containing protein [Chitinimonas sp. BJB300]
MVQLWRNGAGLAVATAWLSDSNGYVQGSDSVLGAWRDDAVYHLMNNNADGKADLTATWLNDDGARAIGTWLFGADATGEPATWQFANRLLSGAAATPNSFATMTLMSAKLGLDGTVNWHVAPKPMAGFASGEQASALAAPPSLDLNARSKLQTQLAGAKPLAVVHHVFDEAGREAYTVDATGIVTQHRFDALGNKSTTTRFASVLTAAAPYTFAALDAWATTAAKPAQDQQTRYVYDALNREQYKVDSQRAVTETRYDAAGRITQVIRYSTPLAATALTDNPTSTTIATALKADAALDLAVRYGYDAAGRQRYVIDGLGFVTEKQYDGAGNVYSQRTYHQAIDLAAWDAQGTLALVKDDAHDVRKYQLVDDANRPLFDVDAAGYVTRYQYDATGLLSGKVVYGQALTFTGEPSLQAVLAGLPAQTNAVVDVIEQYTYDTAGRIQFVVDGAGRVSQRCYDGANRQTRTIQYATRYDAATGLAPYTTLGVNDRVTETVYDLLGRAVYLIDAEGKVTEQRYNALDQKTHIVRYADRVAVDRTRDMTASALSVRFQDVGKDDRQTRHYYDAAGRLSYSVNDAGQVSRFSYDSLGRLLHSAQFAKLAPKPEMTLAELQTQYSALDSATDRRTYSVYDQHGREVFTVDTLGNVTEKRYDVYGQLVGKTDYAKPIATLADISITGVRALLKADAQDRQQSYRYNAAGNLVDKQDALGQHDLYTYGATGKQLTHTDARGNKTVREYDGRGLLIAQTDGTGNVSRVTYNAQGLSSTVTDGKGQTSTRTYDGAGQLIASTDALNHSERYEYDVFGNRLKTTDKLGNVSQSEFDRGNRLVKQTDALGRITQNQYDENGNLVRQTDAKQQVTTRYYDRQGRVISSINPAGEVTEYRYDTYGQLVSTLRHHERQGAAKLVQDDRDALVRREYNVAGQLVRQVDALKGETTYRYDRFGNLAETTNAGGQVTRTEYDALNRVTASVDALGKRTTYEYDASGNRKAMVDALGHRTEYEYDAANRLVKTTDATGASTQYRYDANGQQVEVTDGRGNKQLSTYDAVNQLLTTTNGAGDVTRYAYDAAGRRISVTNGAGNVTASTFDAAGQLKTLTDGTGAVTQYRYDNAGNLLSTVDGNGNEQTRRYDAANRLVATTDGLGLVTEFAYDTFGRKLSQSRAGVVQASEYDLLDRLVAQVDGEGYRTEYAYDALGNVAEMRRAIDKAGTQWATTRYGYDAQNRRIYQLDPGQHLTYTEYADDGQVSARTVYDGVAALPATPPTGPGRTVRYQYDANHHVISEKGVDGSETLYAYDKAGNLEKKTEFAGTPKASVTTYRYDGANRLVGKTEAEGKTTQIVYDGAGRISQRITGSKTETARTETFAYDGVGHVVREQDGVGNVTVKQYDKNGNLVLNQQAHGTAALRETRYRYDANNQQIEAKNTAGVQRTEYDAFGNKTRVKVGETNAVTSQFFYDKNNQLVRTVDGMGITAEFTVDGLGRQLQSTDAANQGTKARLERKTYDADGHVLTDTDAAGYTTRYQYDVQGNRTSMTVGEYLLVATDAGYDATRAALAQPAKTTYTYDAVGRLVSTLSPGGTLVTQSYDAAGNIETVTTSDALGANARVTRFGYDRQGRRISETDANDYTTQFTYNEFGEKSSATRGLYLVPVTDAQHYDAAKAVAAKPSTTQYEYDANGRLAAEINGAGNRTEYQYDAQGNKSAVILAAGTPLARQTTYLYDGAGRLVETLTAEGGRTLRKYDAVFGDLVVSEDILQSNKAGNEVWLHRTFKYDNNRRLTTELTDAGQTMDYGYDVYGNRLDAQNKQLAHKTSLVEYDVLDRKLAETDIAGNRSTYHYDSRGNVISKTDALGQSTYFYYDADNRVIATIDPMGYLKTARYDVHGSKVEERQYALPVAKVGDFVVPKGKNDRHDRIATYSYDAAGRLSLLTAADGSQIAYVRDGRGNVLAERKFANLAKPRVTQYQYDGADRVTQQIDPAGLKTEKTYDAAGNLSRLVEQGGEQAAGINRTTVYEYDRDNRQISETKDPGGLKITNRIEYDKVGNLVAHVDGNGNRREFLFDGLNRTLSETNGLGQTVNRYSYDALGRVEKVEGKDGVVSYTYDRNNRKLTETRNLNWMTFDAQGHSTVTRYRYDTLGNLQQTTLPSGAQETRWYDKGGRLVALLDVDNVLREYQHDAYNDVVKETAYLERLEKIAQDPTVRPKTPKGETHVISREYDLAGRPTRVVYPQVDVTRLTSRDRGNPATVTERVAPEERYVYDGYGAVADSTNKEGRRTLSWYDGAGRVSAVVDAAGYLNEASYDAAGNRIQQRAYVTPLNLAGLNPLGDKPVGQGAVAVTDYRYDAAGRLVEQLDPARNVRDSLGNTVANARPVTRTRYDSANNVVQQIKGADTADALNVFHYYDAAGRLIGTINPSRMLTLYSYDNVGNRVAEQRFGNAVGAGVDLAGQASDFGALYKLVGDHADDQATLFRYDDLHRLKAQREAQGAIVRNATGQVTELTGEVAELHYGYDTLGNRTYVRNAKNQVTSSQFDAKSRVTKVVNVDGSGTISRYDALGNRVFVYTGEMPNAAVQPAGIAATQGDTLNINWNLPTASEGRTWVVYDLQPHAKVDDYPARVGEQLASLGGHTAQLPRPPAGTQVYFRVVSQDVAGNMVWSEEQTLTVAPQYDSVETSRTAKGELRMLVHFDGAVEQPRIVWQGSGSTMNHEVTLTALEGGYYAAVLGDVGPLNQFNYSVVWQDATHQLQRGPSQTLTNAVQRFSPTTTAYHQVINPEAASADTYQYKTVLQVAFNNDQSDMKVLRADWRKKGSSEVANRSSITGRYEQGRWLFDLVLGDKNTPMAVGDYEITLSGMRLGGETVEVDRLSYTVSALAKPADAAAQASISAPPVKLQHVTWTATQLGINGQWVMLDGQLQTVDNQGGASVLDGKVINEGMHNLDVHYTQSVKTSHMVTGRVAPAIRTETTAVPGQYIVKDAAGREIYVIDPQGFVTETRYDAVGNPITKYRYAKPIQVPTVGSVDQQTLTLNGTNAALRGTSFANIDMSKQYKVRIRLRQLTGQGVMSSGVTTLNAAGVELHNAGSTFSYAAVADKVLTPEMGWQTFEGLIGGENPPNAGAALNHNKFLAGSVKAAPLLLYSYGAASNGDPSRLVELDTLELIDVATGEVISANSNMGKGASDWALVNGGFNNANNGVALNADLIKILLRPDAANDKSSPFVDDGSGLHIPGAYDYTYTANLSAEEIAGVRGDVKLLLTRQSDKVEQTVTLTRDGNRFSAKLRELKGDYTFKAYYFDAQDRMVIVDWHTQSAKDSYDAGGCSGTVVAKEEGISLNRNAGNLWVGSGTYLGALAKPKNLFLNVAVKGTGLTAGSRQSDGRDNGYYLETRYDAMGHTVASMESDGIWREHGIDLAGNAVRTDQYDKQGGSVMATTYADYDGRGRKVAEWGAAYQAVTSADDATGRQQRLLTQSRYNQLDQLTDQVVLYRDVAGDVFTAALDGSNGARQTHSYNLGGNRTDSKNALGQNRHSDFDIHGRETSTVDALGFRSSKTYDVRGNLGSETNGAGGVTRHEYDTLGRETTRIDGNGNRTALKYNRRNHLVQQGTTVFGYDFNGNRTSSLRGTYKVEQGYDALNRVISTRTWQLGQEVVESRRYDVYGNLILEVDGEGRTKSYRYGAFNRLLESTDETGLTNRFEYDGLGRQIRESNSEGKDIRRSWDAAGHLLRVADYGKAITQAGSTSPLRGWNAIAKGLMQRVTAHLQSSMTTTPANPANAVLVKYTDYRFDERGQKIREISNGVGEAATYGRDTRYSYDALGRQTGWAEAATGVGSQQTYDANGNVVRITGTGRNAFDHVYAFDGANRVTQEIKGGELRHSYVYDGAGNRLQDYDAKLGTTVNYLYDAENRVTVARWYGSATAQSANAGFKDPVAMASLGIIDRNSDSITLQSGPMEVTVALGEGRTRRLLAEQYLGSGDLWQRIVLVGGGTAGADSALALGTRVSFNRTLRDVARAQYGDESGWNEIAKANGLNNADAELAAGTQLKVPHLWQQTWEYDANGNIIRQNKGYGWFYAQSSASTYTENNLKIQSTEASQIAVRVPGAEGGGFRWLAHSRVGSILTPMQVSKQTYDRSGRMTGMLMHSYNDLKLGTLVGPVASGGVISLKQYWKGGRMTFENSMGTEMVGGCNTYYFGYNYHADGRMAGITGSGPKGASGNSSFEYDVNRQLVKQVQGQGDGMVDNERSIFIRNTDGQVIHKVHHTGRSGESIENIHYLYANGHAVGETGVYADGTHKTQLDEGRFARIESLGKDHPGSGVGTYTVQGGETLRHIAGQVYGNSNLWYLLADANGLSEDTELKAGTRITIPNTSKSDAISADTFKAYKEDEVVGSQMPNLKTPPPKKKCGAFGVLMQIVVTIAVAYATGGNVALASHAGKKARQYTDLIVNNEFDWGRFFDRSVFNPFGGNKDDFFRSIVDPMANGAPDKVDYKGDAFAMAAAYAGNYVGGGFAGPATTYTVNHVLNKLDGRDVHFSMKQIVAQGTVNMLVPGGGMWGQVARDALTHKLNQELDRKGRYKGEFNLRKSFNNAALNAAATAAVQYSAESRDARFKEEAGYGPQPGPSFARIAAEAIGGRSMAGYINKQWNMGWTFTPEAPAPSSTMGKFAEDFAGRKIAGFFDDKFDLGWYSPAPAEPMPGQNRSEIPRNWRSLFDDEDVGRAGSGGGIGEWGGGGGAGGSAWEPAIGDRGQVAYRRPMGHEPMDDPRLNNYRGNGGDSFALSTSGDADIADALANEKRAAYAEQFNGLHEKQDRLSRLKQDYARNVEALRVAEVTAKLDHLGWTTGSDGARSFIDTSGPYETRLVREQPMHEGKSVLSAWNGERGVSPGDRLRQLAGNIDQVASSGPVGGMLGTGYVFGSAYKGSGLDGIGDKTFMDLLKIGQSVDALAMRRGHPLEPMRPQRQGFIPQTNSLTVVSAWNPYGISSGVPSASNSGRYGGNPELLKWSLAEQAGIPKYIDLAKPDNVWGLDGKDLISHYRMRGFEGTMQSPRAGTSGNAQVFSLNNHPSISSVQYSPDTRHLPPSQRSVHKGEYYKFTTVDGVKVKILDPQSYQIDRRGWPEKNTTYFNQNGKAITYDLETNKWMEQRK